MTGCGWEEGIEGSKRGEEGRREAEGRQEGTQRRCLMGLLAARSVWISKLPRSCKGQRKLDGT